MPGCLPGERIKRNNQESLYSIYTKSASSGKDFFPYAIPKASGTIAGAHFQCWIIHSCCGIGVKKSRRSNHETLPPALFFLGLLFLGMACALPGSIATKLVYNNPSEPEALTEIAANAATETIPVTKPLAPVSQSEVTIETPIDFNHGELTILYDRATIETPNEDWFKPMWGCWPSSYYDDGGGF